MRRGGSATWTLLTRSSPSLPPPPPVQNPLVTQLSLYDVQGTPGVAADLSHVNTPAIVKASGGKGGFFPCRYFLVVAAR